MFAAGTIELTKLVFNPEESIRFHTGPGKQRAVVEVTNNHSFDVIFKWKSTRPPIYGVEPNFVIVKAKTTKQFVLFCRGFEREYSTPRDRFSADISRIKPTNVDAKQIWRNSRYRNTLFEGKLHKKYIYVVFDGMNKDEWWNRDMQGNMEPKRQPTFGLAEDDGYPPVVTALLAGRFTHIIVPLEPARDEDTPGDDDDNSNH